MGNGGIHPGDISRRMRNRTLTGLETMQRMGGGGAAANGVGAMDHLRPGSASGRPITPSFSNDKEPGQTFIDFNPAGMKITHRNKTGSDSQYCLNVFGILLPNEV